MAFNGREGNPIALSVAKEWTKKYSDANKGKTRAIFYGKEKLLALLNEPNSMGIRIYFAINDSGDNSLVLVSATADKNNILPSDEGKDGGGTLLDDGKPCPPDCPPDNDL